ncbi:hypothetical protein OLMES_2055 [Oleiphilus messinensis]|uniref:High frequency lysogenization protein HflD homolog n=1 Tax=Oleiphilus messinensis TaxID=141451 RepID=A0A1Y0I6K9_9GAMM|nr:high frequency lysogenization protein HflD [Oleiphilus messinensis]ARU56128.1 hypothetical protein OLMES_2055 [Oleiphilus messinensis]
MSYTTVDQTIALAGIFQAASLVQQIAHNGSCAPQFFETSLNSLFVINPADTIGVFGQAHDIRLGLRELLAALDKNNKSQNVETIRYALSLVHLENKLKKRQDLLSVISKRLAQATEQKEHFGGYHPNIIENLASIYTDTISTFNLRIQVVGQPNHLQVEENAAKIRALLLAGIRSAMLWRQVGGRRWQLLFKRKALAECAEKQVRNI